MGRGIVPRKVQRNTVIKHFFENVLIFAVYGIDNFPYICYTFLGGENMDLIKIGKFIEQLQGNTEMLKLIASSIESIEKEDYERE